MQKGLSKYKSGAVARASGGNWGYNTPTPTEPTYYGSLANGTYGQSADLGAFQPGSVTAAQSGGNLYGTNQAPSGMDWSGTMGNVGQGANALAGLANAYLGYQNYKLAKDKYGFEKAATNRSLANQASEYNTGIQNAGEVGMSLAGNTMDPNQRAARQAQLNAQKISTAPIG